MIEVEWWDGGKDWYDANGKILRIIVSNQCALKKRLLLCANHTRSWLSVRCTMVTVTILAAMEFRDFYVLFITLTHLTFKRNATVASSHFLCVTRSAEAA